MMIKAKQFVEVSIDDAEIRRITVGEVRKLVNLPALGMYEHYYIKDGDLWQHWDNDRGNHSSNGEVKLRKASELDIAVVSVLNALGY